MNPHANLYISQLIDESDSGHGGKVTQQLSAGMVLTLQSSQISPDLVSSPAVNPRKVCESRFVSPTGLNKVTGDEDIDPDSDHWHPFVIHRRTHKCTRSFWQVCCPSSIRERRIELHF